MAPAPAVSTSQVTPTPLGVRVISLEAMAIIPEEVASEVKATTPVERLAVKATTLAEVTAEKDIIPAERKEVKDIIRVGVTMAGSPGMML